VRFMLEMNDHSPPRRSGTTPACLHPGHVKEGRCIDTDSRSAFNSRRNIYSMQYGAKLRLTFRRAGSKRITLP
jgi:hypothetical protein